HRVPRQGPQRHGLDVRRSVEGRTEARRRQRRQSALPEPGQNARHPPADRGGGRRHGGRSLAVAGAALVGTERRRVAPFRVAFDLLIINLRYHIVSLVAVFLALAIGVIAGTTVINDQVVKGLERSDGTLRRLLKAQQDANASLNGELNLWQTWGGSVAKGIEQDKLKGKT